MARRTHTLSSEAVRRIQSDAQAVTMLRAQTDVRPKPKQGQGQDQQWLAKIEQVNPDEAIYLVRRQRIAWSDDRDAELDVEDFATGDPRDVTVIATNITELKEEGGGGSMNVGDIVHVYQSRPRESVTKWYFASGGPGAAGFKYAIITAVDSEGETITVKFAKIIDRQTIEIDDDPTETMPEPGIPASWYLGLVWGDNPPTIKTPFAKVQKIDGHLICMQEVKFPLMPEPPDPRQFPPGGCFLAG